eukprot:gene56805-biopygen53269
MEHPASVQLGHEQGYGSDMDGGPSSRAIDGSDNSDNAGGSCTHTNSETNPWWRVDLSAEYPIGVVRITPRHDCCQERLNGFEVRAGSIEGDGSANHNCGNGGHRTPVTVVTVDCGGVRARYVN